MAVLSSRSITPVRGGAPLTFLVIETAADLPAVARCSIGDTAYGTSGADDGKCWEVQKRSTGAAWVNVTPGGTSPGASVVPTADNTYDLGSGTFAWRYLYVKTALVGDAALGIDLPDAGTSQLTIGNSGGGVCNVATDGTLIFQNGASGANLFAFGGVPTGSREIKFPDESGTVPLLTRAGQTFTEPVAFQNGVTTAEASGSYGFTALGFTLRLMSSGVSANRTITFPAPAVDDVVCLLTQPQTIASKTISRGKLPVLTVAGVGALSSPTEGELAYASDGRKPGEGGGAGTGVMAYYDGSAWCSVCDGTALAA